jgi:hypothetical protein
LLGEGDPDPFADDLGQVVSGGEPLPEEVEDLVGGQCAICFALLVVYVGEDAGRLWLL